MRPAAVLTSALTILTTANAKIYGFAAPKTIAAGSTIQLKIIAEDYIQSIQDVAMAFGIQPASNAAPDSLGTLLGEKFLGPDDSNIVGNITVSVNVPSGTPKGKVVLTGSLFSLLGADLEPSTESFVVDVTVGKHTSTTYITSNNA